MGHFLDTTGNTTLGIALCARCSRKMPLGELYSDPNSPNLMVCKEDLDKYDPYRLAPRPVDQITLPFVRPDLPLTQDQYGIISQDGEEYVVTEDDTGYLYAKKRF
jgi:hypothetical protein